MKTLIIHHSADFDGLFCREIARKFLPDADIIGWDYGQPLIPFPKEGMVFILDLSMDCIQASDIPDDWRKRVVWIDHHKSAMEKWSQDLPGYRIDGVAACRLAWQWFANPDGNHALPVKESYVVRNVAEPEAVRLAGEYDVWDKRDPRVDLFQLGLRSKPLTDEDWKWLLTDRTGRVSTHDFMKSQAVVMEFVQNGRIIQPFVQQADVHRMKSSFLVILDDIVFLALNSTAKGSMQFGPKDVPATMHDGLLKFHYDGTLWDVSLYHARHNTGIDLSEIAKRYGGGGHRGACGFRARQLVFSTIQVDQDKHVLTLTVMV